MIIVFSIIMRTVTLVFFIVFLTVTTCRESEKEALLLFKHDLKDPSNRLSSWVVADDCCQWNGITCDNLTGHVHEIDLRYPYDLLLAIQSDADYDANYFVNSLGGKINPSLVNLKHLHRLDLSGNYFEGTQIPSFIGSLGSLRYLNLSWAGFGGMIPHQLGNLSMLSYLDLGGQDYSENLQWLSGLSSLEYLDMSWVNLTKANDWLQVTNMLPSLVELHLSYCGLSSNIIPRETPLNFTSLAVLDISSNSFSSLIPWWLHNFTNLRHLDMSLNSLNVTMPNWLYSLTHLQFLNLRSNYLEGEISNAIGNLSSLITLDLSDNQLRGEIPRSLGNLCNLRNLDLSGNKLTGGDVSEVLKKFSGCNSHKIESLKLASSQLSGQLPDDIGQFINLVELDLDRNSITGPIPESIGRLSALKKLSLYDNSFNGTLTESLGQLSKLEYLDIYSNSLNGVVSEVHFANLSRLTVLFVGDNNLTLKLSDEWAPPFKLRSLSLQSSQLGPQFPLWLQSQRNLKYLDLSNTGISNSIPTWFPNILSQALILNLSHNHIHGDVQHIINSENNMVIDLSSNNFTSPLPRLSTKIGFLDLSNNSFSGSLYRFLCNGTEESKYLEYLNLGYNLLRGEIPDCWMNWQSLKAIRLDNNYLSGTIPSSMGYLTSLSSLHLRNNNLSGILPVSLQNWTELKAIDLSQNEFTGSIPTWIEKWSSTLLILNLRSNKFRGNIPHEHCRLTSLQLLDLANNNLFGTIPRCFNNFSAMGKRQYSNTFVSYLFRFSNSFENAFLVTKGRAVEYSTTLNLLRSIDLSKNNLTGDVPVELTSLVELQSLNLSDNHLSGKIPAKIDDMRFLESLDFSMNQLSGEIPSSMSSLTFLSHLNLSFNKLEGKIPSSTQLQGFDESGFIGNSLCGPPLTMNCSENGKPLSVNIGGKNGDGFEVDFWFFVSMGLGFIVGFWVVFGPLLFNMSWRVVYFRFLDSKWEKLCDFIFRCHYIFNN